MKSYQRFFAELKPRQVFKVATVYVAVGFVVLHRERFLREIATP